MARQPPYPRRKQTFDIAICDFKLIRRAPHAALRFTQQRHGSHFTRQLSRIAGRGARISRSQIVTSSSVSTIAGVRGSEARISRSQTAILEKRC